MARPSTNILPLCPLCLLSVKGFYNAHLNGILVDCLVIQYPVILVFVTDGNANLKGRYVGPKWQLFKGRTLLFNLEKSC